jgi:hypothetical protein
MKVSAVHAKAHFSELVAAAEHKGTITEIQKHGRTAAIIGPRSLLEKKKTPKRPGMTAEEIAALWASFEAERIASDPHRSAVEDLLANRR